MAWGRCLLALLLVPVAAAAEGDGDPLSAKAAAWEGSEVVGSRLIAVRQVGEAADFRLSAQHLHVRTVHAEAFVQVSPLGAYAPSWESREADFTNASLRSTTARDEGVLFVVPVEGRPAPSLAVGCGSGARAADEGVPRQVASQIEQPNPNPEWDVADALAFTPCGGELEVCGALTLVLWEQDAAGTTGEGPVEFQSGQSARPGEPDARPFLGRAQQLYLSTPDGCFAMAPTGSTGVLVEGLALTAGAVSLRGAEGSVGGASVPVGSDLDLAGSLSLRLDRGAGGVAVSGLSGVEAVRLNGEPIALATLAPEGAGAGGWTPALWLVLLPAAAALALWLRRRSDSPQRWLGRLYAASEQDQATKVVQAATRLLERDAYPLEARVARAAASLDLDEFERSLADCKAALDLVGFRRPAQRASIATLACRAASLLGRTDEAVAWLGEVYTNDLQAAQDAVQYPEVRRLLPSTPGYS